MERIIFGVILGVGLLLFIAAAITSLTKDIFAPTGDAWIAVILFLLAAALAALTSLNLLREKRR